MTAKEKMEEYGREYEKYSDTLSTACRQLAFAEGGAFWILVVNTDKLTNIILWGFIVLVLFFIFDTLQYAFGTIDYHNLFIRCREKLCRNPHVKSSEINKGNVGRKITLFFFLKLISIFIASILLLIGFVNKFFSLNLCVMM